MNRDTKRNISRIVIIMLLAAFVLIVNQSRHKEAAETLQNTPDVGTMKVHFIDVGQGDSMLIEAEDAAMLIDAGGNNQGSVVVDYLKAHNISQLDYVIGTHPHSDHIGGLDTVLDAIPVEAVIMPDVVHDTKTFEDVLDALERNSLKITKPVTGATYSLGQASFTILAPNSSTYEELNDYSIVIRLTNGKNSFVFTGDAGTLSEEEMLADGTDLSADVLKLAHHGSTTASSESFLDAVNPAYAVISVGKNNDYGHPHAEILQRIKDKDIKLYRTDAQGTIIFTSDGKNITVNKDAYEITAKDLERQ